MISGFALLLLAHFVFVNFDDCDPNDKCYEGIFPMTLIGLSNTMIQLTLYPSVNYLVKERHFGTAYGIIESFCNVGLLIGSLSIGFILNTNYDWGVNEIVDLSEFKTVHIFLIILAVISIYLSIKVVRYDMSRQGKKVLNAVITFTSKKAEFDNFGSNENSDVSELEDNFVDDPNPNHLHFGTQQTLHEPLLPDTSIVAPVKKANPHY